MTGDHVAVKIVLGFVKLGNNTSPANQVKVTQSWLVFGHSNGSVGHLSP